MQTYTRAIITAALITPLLAACGGPERTATRDTPYYGNNTVRTAPAGSTGHRDYRCNNCGVVTDIEQVKAESNGVAGAVIGGVLGGVAGHQVGKGTGKDLATAAGAVGGAVAGHEIEQSRTADYEYRIRVRMDNGDTVTVKQQNRPPVGIGDQVQVVDGQVIPQG